MVKFSVKISYHAVSEFKGRNLKVSYFLWVLEVFWFTDWLHLLSRRRISAWKLPTVNA